MQRLLRLAIALALYPAASLPAQQGPDYVARGIAATEAHDLRTGLGYFEQALGQDSMSYEANWRAALTLGLLGDVYPTRAKSPERDSFYTRAERYARRAVAARPEGADGHFALAASVGRASLTMDNEARVHRANLVRNEALRTLALDPRHDGAYHILGRWNAEIMRLPGLSRFVARNFLGARVFDQASWDRAVQYLSKAVELDPGRIYHRLALADVYADLDRRDAAEAQLRAVDSLPLREPMDTNYKRQAEVLRDRLARK